ncbi:MAG: hypothetical protein AAGA99_24380 [Actinomycetota bacterium]
MDQLKQLTQGQQIFAGGAAVLFIAYFLPWFSLDAFGVSANANGSDVGALFGTIPMLLGLVMLAVIVLRAVKPDVQLPDLPWPQVTFGVGVFAGAMVLLKLIIGEDDGGLGIISRSFGLYLATIAALAMAAGGFLEFQRAKNEA